MIRMFDVILRPIRSRGVRSRVHGSAVLRSHGIQLMYARRYSLSCAGKACGLVWVMVLRQVYENMRRPFQAPESQSLRGSRHKLRPRV